MNRQGSRPTGPRTVFVRRAAAGALLMAAAAAGCARLTPPADLGPAAPTPDERRTMQTHSYAAGVDTVFAATIAVLQDLGWNLDTADRAAGILRASTQRRLEALGPQDEKQHDLTVRRKVVEERSDVAKKWTRWQELIIHTEPWTQGQTRQRIVMNLRGTLPAMSYRDRIEGGFMQRGREVMINAPPVEQTVEVELAEAYADMFERISAAVSQRRSGSAP